MKGSTKRGPKRNGNLPVAAPAPAGTDERTRVYARRPATRKEHVLAQWRGVDVRAEEIASRATDRPAGSVVTGVLKKLKLDQRQAETEIVKVWNHLIDATLTAHAQPAGIHKGTLFVNVDSSVWLDEIVRYRRKDILTRLQTAFGSELVKRISFRVG